MVLEYRYGKAIILEHNGVSFDKPTLFFFGGQGERASIERTYEIISNVELLEKFIFICVAIYKDRDHQDMDVWRKVAENLYEYIQDRYKQGVLDVSRIYLDGYSNGGAGAFYTAINIHKREVFDLKERMTKIVVKKLTLIEGVLDYTMKSRTVEDFLNSGTDLVLYVSKEAKLNVSKNGRKLMEEFGGREHFYSMLVDYGHGNRIVSLVYEEPYESHKYDF